ncbi:hypothetical protein ACNFIA_17525 [Pseudomonas sp. NY15437]|uniref:hypothetical protein n=1 Tax=Pseudomonas sp. NY15437 TaxID=3400360 RepID=UPI003A8776BA
MEFAHALQADGSIVQVRADGVAIGTADTDRKLLHLLPKLLLDDPTALRLELRSVRLEILADVEGLHPSGGVVIRQPYPNPLFLVGGSATNRNGWCVPAENLPNDFQVEFRWTFERLLPGGTDWVVRHLIRIRLLPGENRTYTMTVSNWRQRGGAVSNMYRYAMAFLKPSLLRPEHWSGRPSLAVEVLSDGSQGVLYREELDIPSIPYEEATGIHQYQELQLHEHVHRRADELSTFFEEHMANGTLQMPARVLVEAIELARTVPYQMSRYVGATPGSEGDCSGQLEAHPALRFICEWWNTHRTPEENELPAAMVMPYVRVQDNEVYWCGNLETPKTPIKDMGCVASSSATCGGSVLLHFMASVKQSKYPEGYLDILCLDGTEWVEVSITRDEVARGEYDEAYFCLDALAGFPSNFPTAYQDLCNAAQL